MGIAQVTNNYRMRCYADKNSSVLNFLGPKDIYVTFGKGTSYRFFYSYPNISSFDKLYIYVYKNAMVFSARVEVSGNLCKAHKYNSNSRMLTFFLR